MWMLLLNLETCRVETLLVGRFFFGIPRIQDSSPVLDYYHTFIGLLRTCGSLGDGPPAAVPRDPHAGTFQRL